MTAIDIERQQKREYIESLLSFMKKGKATCPDAAVRKATIAYFTENLSQKEAGARYNISQSAVARLINRLNELDVKVQRACIARKNVEAYDDFTIN